KVVAGCPKPIYPSPTSTSVCSLDWTCGMFSSTLSASATVELRRSEIDKPLYWIANVSLLYRLPRQTSHETYTFGKKLISILRNPSPWHASQRPPLTLKLNRPAL